MNIIRRLRIAAGWDLHMSKLSGIEKAAFKLLGRPDLTSEQLTFIIKTAREIYKGQTELEQIMREQGFKV